MERRPYTRSGEWPDSKLTKIIEETLTEAAKKHSSCCSAKIVTRGFGEVAWDECSRCGERLGSYVG